MSTAPASPNFSAASLPSRSDQIIRPLSRTTLRRPSPRRPAAEGILCVPMTQRQAFLHLKSPRSTTNAPRQSVMALPSRRVNTFNRHRYPPRQAKALPSPCFIGQGWGGGPPGKIRKRPCPPIPTLFRPNDAALNPTRASAVNQARQALRQDNSPRSTAIPPIYPPLALLRNPTAPAVLRPHPHHANRAEPRLPAL